MIARTFTFALILSLSACTPDNGNRDYAYTVRDPSAERKAEKEAEIAAQVVAMKPDIDLTPAAAMASLVAKGLLPPNFEGVNDLDFVQHLAEANAGVEPSKFETRAEFEKRFARVVLPQIAPIDLETPYPFELSPYLFKSGGYTQEYDAEKEIATVTIEVTGGTGNSGNLDSKTPWSIPLQSWTLKGESYVGENAFGVKKEIQRATKTLIYMYVPNKDPVLARAGLKAHWDTGYYMGSKIVFRIPWKRDEARAAGGEYPLTALLVARLTSARTGKNKNLFQTKPTIDDPNDIEEFSYGIEGRLTALVVYVASTGKILKYVAARQRND